MIERASIFSTPTPLPKPKRVRVTRHRVALTLARIKAAKPGSTIGDGGCIGLWLRTSESGRQQWLLRYMLNNGRHEMGLGPVELVGLDEARDLCRHYRKLKLQGIDPIQHRRAEMDAKRAASETFQTVSEAYLEAHSTAWKRGDRVVSEWRYGFQTYCKSLLLTPIRDVNTDAVLKVIKPMWSKEPRLAESLRNRIERVLGYAISHGMMGADKALSNPARWKGHMANLLPRPENLAPRKHRPALNYKDIGGFMAKLRAEKTSISGCLQLVIMAATRSDEVRLATWSEVNIAEKTLTIPGSRMKGKREHIVPLTPQMLALLEEQRSMKRRDDFIFPGKIHGHPVSGIAMLKLTKRISKDPELVVHGFRSTFRDWAGDKTDYPREITESALAHTVGSQVEQAYRRGSALDKRRQLMNDWNAYIGTVPRVVVQIRQEATA